MRNGIDLEGVLCVDLGHRWKQTYLGRAVTGKLRGLPVRTLTCETCGSQRSDYMTWNGQVEARTYDLDETYIVNARRLDDDMHQRRVKYRAELCRQVRNMRIAAIEEASVA